MDPITRDRLVLLLAGVALCVLCAVRAARAEPRSRRLALASLACAVAVLPIVAGAFLIGRAESPAGFIVAGVLAVAVGGVAIGLSLRAKAAKKLDGGTGNVAPAAALVLGVAGSLLGLWMIAASPG